MQVSKRLLRGISWLSLLSALSALVSFGGSIVLARVLIPEQFGTYALAMTVSGMIALFVRFSFRSAIVQCREPIPDFIHTAFIFILGMGAAHLAISLIAYWGVVHFYGQQVALGFMVLTVMAVIKYFGNGLSALLERKLQYQSVGWINLSTNLASYFFALLAVWQGAGWWALVVRDIANTLMFLMINWTITKHRFRWRYNREAAQYIWRFGRSLFVAEGIEGLLQKIDNWVVGTFLGKAPLGLYSIGFRLSGVTSQFIEPVFGRGSFGAYSELQHEKDRLARAFELVNFWLIRVTVPLAIAAFFLAEPAITWLYGEDWRDATPILQGLIILILLGPISSNCRVFLTAIGKPNWVARNRVWQLLLTIILLIPATHYGGVVGVAWAMSLSLLALFTLLLIQANKIISIDFFKLYVRPVLVGVATAIITYILFTLIPFQGYSNWLIVLAGGISICAIYLTLLAVVEYKTLKFNTKFILKRFR